MDNKNQHLFGIKRFKGEKNLENDFTSALLVYNAETPAVIKTNTNELASWIRNPRNATFEVLAFILYCDEFVAGFAMLTYHTQIKVITYEYIALKTIFSSFASYFSYLDLLNRYITDNGYDVLYWITEINNKDKGTKVDKESTLFKKLLCLNQFGKLDVFYKTFPLEFDEDSIFEAILYIKTNDRIQQISKETYIKIVDAIKSYYACWYQTFMTTDDFKRYNELLKEIYNQIINKVSVYSSIHISYIDCPLLTPEEKIHTSIMPKVEIKRYSWLRVALILLFIIMIATALTICIYYIFKCIGIEISQVAIIIANAVSTLTTSYIALKSGRK